MTHPYYHNTVANGYTPEAEAEYKIIADRHSAAAPDLLAECEGIAGLRAAIARADGDAP